MTVIWTLNKFRNYLYDCEFTLRTDHTALISILKGSKQLTDMLIRWTGYLQEYQYKAEHVQGKYNLADAPSRLVSAVDKSFSDLTLLYKYLKIDELLAQSIDHRRIKRKVSNHFL